MAKSVFERMVRAYRLGEKVSIQIDNQLWHGNTTASSTWYWIRCRLGDSESSGIIPTWCKSQSRAENLLQLEDMIDRLRSDAMLKALKKVVG